MASSKRKVATNIEKKEVTSANEIFLAQKATVLLRHIGDAEFENDISFCNLVLGFELSNYFVNCVLCLELIIMHCIVAIIRWNKHVKLLLYTF